MCLSSGLRRRTFAPSIIAGIQSNSGESHEVGLGEVVAVEHFDPIR
jgi:hypothetical protein